MIFAIYRARAGLAAAGLASVLGCSSSGTTVIQVTVDAPPAVHGFDVMEVSLVNGGDTHQERFDVSGTAWPLDFTFTADGRTGKVDIDIQVYEHSLGYKLMRGRGSAATTVMASAHSDVQVMLETTDFVVNSGFAGAQALTSSNSAGRRQIAVAGDGSLVVVYEAGCTTARVCQILGRRFGSDGRPLANQVNGETREFPLALGPASSMGHSPAIAVSDSQYLVTWIVRDASFGGDLLVGVRMDLAAKHLLSEPHFIAVGELGSLYDQQVVALHNGEFMVVWREAYNGGSTLYGQYIGTSGDPAEPLLALHSSERLYGPTVVAAGPASESAPGSERALVVLWNDQYNVWYLPVDGTGAAPGPAIQLTEYGGCRTCDVYGPSAAWRNGTMTVAWSLENTGVTPELNNLYVQQVGLHEGSPTTAPTVVASSNNADRDFHYKPALAIAPDGSGMVVWAGCGVTGDDGSSCGIFARHVAASGALASGLLPINTATLGDQRQPTIAVVGDAWLVAWTDHGATAPDSFPSAVRARMVYGP